MTRSSKHHSRARRVLFAIAIFKWTKGAILLAVAAGAISLFHKDIQAHVEHWVTACRIDPDNRYIAAGLEKLDLVHTRELKQLSFLSAFYAAIFLTEGTGLALRKRWAEYLTIVATGLLIPTEKKLAPLAMLNHQVNIAIEDQVAVTRIEQTFRNHTDRQLEATYIFPIPKGASVRKF